MDEYGKIFKNKKNNNFLLRPYNPDNEKYFELIKQAKEEGLKQVIVNSEIMVEVLYEILKTQGLILKVSMSETTDQDVKDNISSIVRKLKKDPLLFVKLKEELEWAVDSGSIDINSVDIYRNENRYQIYSNGLIYGTSIESLFKDIIKPVFEGYFNYE